MQRNMKSGQSGKNNTRIHSDIHTHYPFSDDDNLPIPRLSFTAAAAVSAATGLLCFAASYDAEFVFDDSEAVIGNKDLSPDTPLLDVFSHDFWGTKLTSNASHKSYRPLTTLTFRLNRYLAGGLHPAGFHIANIALHSLVCVLLLLAISALHIPPLVARQVTFPASRSALLCTLLFATHPVHTESVAGVVGRADLLCAICFLLSFLAYVHTCNSGGALYIVLSMLMCGLSVLFKEQGITVLGICSAYDVIVHNQIDLLHLIGLKRSLHRCHKQPQFKPLLVRHAVLLLTGVAILVGRWRIMGSATPVFQVVDNPHSFVNGTIIRALNYNYLYSLHTWILLNPWWLCFDWSMGCVPVIEQVSDIRILFIVSFWLLLGVLIYHSLWKATGSDQRMIQMGLAFLVIPFLPASNLFFRVGFVIAERVLYLPSIGCCLLVVTGARQLSSTTTGKKMVLLSFMLLLSLYTIRSIQRSKDWRTEKQLFDSGARVCPLNAKVHYNIAKVHGDEGNEDYAVQKYRLAIKLNPEYDQAMNNLANILKERNELAEAKQLLTKAVKIRPEFAAAWMNLGIVQAALKETVEAEKSYLMALRHRRKYPDCYYNLGNLYLDMGHHALALSAWTNATTLRPTHTSAWVNRLIMLDNLGRLDEVVKVAEEAILHLPHEATIYYNTGNALGKGGRYAESEPFFLQAAVLDPLNSSYEANLGVLYHRWKKFDKAQLHYKKAIELDPNNHSARENYNMLMKKLAREG